MHTYILDMTVRDLLRMATPYSASYEGHRGLTKTFTSSPTTGHGVQLTQRQPCADRH